MLILILAHIILKHYFKHDPLESYDQSNLEWSIRLLRNSAKVVLAVSTIVFGIRDIRKKGFSLSRFFIPLIGITFCVGIISFGAFSNYFLKDIISDTDDIAIKGYEKVFNDEDLSLENKFILSKSYAQMIFHQNGSIMKHYSEDGDIILYKPTAKDIKEREELQKYKDIITKSNASIQVSILLWAIIFVISLILGLFTPVSKQSRVPPNHGIQADAAEPRR